MNYGVLVVAEAPTATTEKAEAKTDHFGTSLDAPHYHLLFIAFLVAVVLLVGLRTVLLVARLMDTRAKKQELEIAAFVLFIIATAGLVGHAIFVPISGAEKWQPLFDATTLGWALLAGLSFLIPVAQEISGAGISVKLETQEKATALAKTATDLLRSWTLAFNEALEQKRSFNLPAQASDWLNHLTSSYVAYRAYDTADWIGTDDERRRLSVWLLTIDPNDQPLANGTRPQRIARFWYSREFRTAPRDFPYLQADGISPEPQGGIIGYVARSQETVNVADASLHPAYVRRPFSGDFKGLYITPITRVTGPNRRPLGILMVDRQKAEKFDSEVINVFEALAEQLAVLMDVDKSY